MPTSFRPVVEKWGSPSSCFLKSDAVERVLTDLSLAAIPTGRVLSTEYDGVNVVWIAEGAKFLDYIESKSINELAACLVDIDDVEGTQSLLSNIQNLSSEWRQQVDEGDGSLRFYVDQY